MTELDGLRALAVLLVIWDHTTRIDLGIGGYHGVLLFFVLSGFLITGILLNARGKAAPLHVLRAFVVRRIPPGYRRRAHVHRLACRLSFELVFHFQGRVRGPAFAPLVVGGGEQFSLLWPWFALFLPFRFLPWAIALMIATGPLSRLVISVAGWNEVAIWVATPRVLDALGLGCLLAYAIRRPKFAERLGNGALIFGVLLMGLQVVGKKTAMPTGFQFVLDRFGWRFVCLWVVYRASRGLGDGPVGRLLRFRPLVYIGTISYGIYLIHNFVLPSLWIIEAHYHVRLPVPHLPGVRHFFLVAGVSTLAASLSWKWLERPLNEVKTRFPYASGRQEPAARLTGPGL